MKKRELVGLVIVSLVLGLVTGVNYAQSSTGNWNSFSLGWLEVQNVNASYYYLGGVNITDELGGTWGALTATTLNTGQGAYELYAMDQDLETSDGVTFGTLDTGQGANELYDMDQNVQTTDDVSFSDLNVTSDFYLNNENRTDAILDGNFTGIGLETPWLDLGGTNRTTWPTGGSNFDQDLNTTDGVTFANVTTDGLYVDGTIELNTSIDVSYLRKSYDYVLGRTSPASGTFWVISGADGSLAYSHATEGYMPIEWCIQQLSETGGSLYFTKAVYNGSDVDHVIQENVSVPIAFISDVDYGYPTGGPYTPSNMPNIMYRINSTGAAKYFTMINIHVQYLGTDIVPWLIRCESKLPNWHNVFMRPSQYVMMGYYISSPLNGRPVYLDNVQVWHIRGGMAYIGCDWVVASFLGSYNSHKNADNVSIPILQIGGTCPLPYPDNTTDSSCVGITLGLLHLFTPVNQPDVALYSSGGVTIDNLDFEGVDSGTALMRVSGGLTIGTMGSVGSGVPDMLYPSTHVTGVNVQGGSQRRYSQKINLLAPAAWTAGAHSTDIGAYMYIPSGTNITSGNNVYYLYNKWLQSHSGQAKIRAQLHQIGTWDVNITAYAYDDDQTANHRLAVVIVNHRLDGANITLAADQDMWIKLTG